MPITENFKSLFKGGEEPATEVPVIKEAMRSLYDEPWADVASTTRFMKPTIDFTPLPKGLPTEEQLSTMDEVSLISLRKKHAKEHNVQNYLAPYEHRARSREAVVGAPFGVVGGILTAAAYSLMIPVYAETKKSRVIPTDVETSTNIGEEVRQGFTGLGEGLKELLGIAPTDKSTQVKEGKIEYTPQQREDIATKEKIDVLIPKLIFTESSGRHTDIEGELISSKVGAKGITQVLPKTGKKPGYGVKPIQDNSKEEYVRFAKDYLFAMMNKFNDMEKALAAYNAGPTAVDRAVMKGERKDKDWKDFLPKETQEYIKKISKEKETTSYGLRPDNTPKGKGWLGELKVPNTNSVATEYSIGVNIGGKEINIPSLVPTLTKKEIEDTLLAISKDQPPSKEVTRKAIEHARKRLTEGKSPFID